MVKETFPRTPEGRIQLFRFIFYISLFGLLYKNIKQNDDMTLDPRQKLQEKNSR